MAIQMMKKPQETSMGRRLLSMAAPVVGGMIGGPVGAAAGGLIGGKLAGASTPEAIMSGAQAGLSAPAQKTNTSGASTANADSAFSRRAGALSEKPEAAIQDGLSVLEYLPADHPLKQELAPGLIRARMMKA